MEALALVAFCFGLGAWLRWSGRLPERAPETLNAWVIQVAVPAIALRAGARLHWDASLFAVASMPWVVLALTALLVGGMGRAMGWSRPVTGAVTLGAGLGNTSFVGFPMVESLLGKEALPTAVAIDQMGSFLALSVLGLWIAGVYGGRRATAAEVVRRILVFPPFLALWIGLAVGRLAPAWLEDGALVGAIAAQLASTLVPVALVAVGAQVGLPLDKKNKSVGRSWLFPLTIGLTIRLVLAPLAVWWAFGSRGLVAQTVVLEAAMAPMITAAIVGASFGLDAGLLNAFLGVGIPLSFATVPIWAWLLRSYG